MSMRDISMALERKSSTFPILPAIATEKRVGTSKIRFMNFFDLQQVMELLQEFGNAQAKLMFGNFDIEILWSQSYISILLENENETLATMILNNYPNVPSLPQNCWEEWLYNKYRMKLMTPYNTLWVHLFLFRNQQKTEVLEAFLKYVFKKYMQVEFVVFVLPPHVPQFNWLTINGNVINPVTTNNARHTQRLLMFRRTSFVSSYKTRRAVVEDNDVIVALFERTCPIMAEMYSKHFIAAIVSSKEKNRQVIVAEYNGRVVAAMILNNQVNYHMLNHCFHLEIMHGLKKDDAKLDMCTDIKGVDSIKSAILQQHPRESNLSDFTLYTSETQLIGEDKTKQVRNDEVKHSTSSGSDVDFDIEMDSLESSDVDEELSEQNSTGSLFIGHLEINMSCVVLSYTGREIQKFMDGRRSSSVRAEDNRQSNVKDYAGSPNAFAIEAIGVAKTHDFAVNLLLFASYECFSDRDYCLLSLPCDEPTPPLLKKFIRAHTKRDVTIPQELYLCHKLSVFGSFTTREAYNTDADAIIDIVGDLRNIRILSMFTTSILDVHTSLRSYVLLCNKRIVGFAILDEETNCDFIYGHYYCKEALADIHGLGINHGKILYFTILPIFEKQSMYFLQELHRLSDYSKLYYSLYPVGNKFIPGIISDMILAVPITTGESKINNKDSKALNEAKSNSALFISTPSVCAQPRIEINTRIVVVGASDVGLSFLIALLLKRNSRRNIHYNNLTIVSAHGISRYNSTTRLIPATSNINKSALDMHALNAYVDVVEGVFTDINRREKTITVSNNTIYYDILILTCGLQYQMPKRVSELRKQRTENPENVFVVNTEVDASLCLDRLRKIWSERQSNVIVYGHTINAYCCIATLLHIGLPEKYLVFVDFTPLDERMKHSESSIFTDPAIEESILSGMEKRGVRLYRGALYNWEFDEEERVNSVTFQCSQRRVTIDCIALFAYETKYVCQTTLQAIRAAGLVFDGGLVITPDFRTNDPNIFAAGTCTKYPRNHHALNKKQKYYSQVEIGRELATIIIGKIMNTENTDDPFESFRCISRHKYFVPEYIEPLYVSCILPRGVNYFCVRKPGPMYNVGISSEGEVLTTGDPKLLDKQGYFRIRINKYGVIDEIACLSKRLIDTVDLTKVWGKHETLFKKLYTRYKVGQIPDFFKFFRGEEFYPYYHHMFSHLLEEIMRVMIVTSSEDGEDDENELRIRKQFYLMNDILDMFKLNKQARFKSQHFRLLVDLFSGSVYEQKILQMVLNFLSEHKTFLPMYAHPTTLQVILAGYRDSGFFRDREDQT